MAKSLSFTEEKRAELLSNPYTSRVSDCRVYFSLAFKQLVMENIDKEDMTARKVFRLAGYRDELFTSDYRKRAVQRIRKESASLEGLREPKTAKKYAAKKKRNETEFRELENRVKILEQQVEFLKKSRHLKDTGQIIPPRSSG